MPRKLLYHLISKKDIPGVLRDGLSPRRGCNTSAINDDRDAVFLCDKQDIEYWQVLLSGKTDVLAVDISGIPKENIEKLDYSFYAEHIVSCPIPPERISYARPLDKASSEYNAAMISLCESYLIGMSYFALECARYYGEEVRSEQRFEYMLQDGLSLEVALPRLDYGIEPQERWEGFVREYGADGEYTFCDFHNNTQVKLYQKLTEYPDDGSAPYRAFVRDYIENAFPWAKDLDTGGWADYRLLRSQIMTGKER